MNDARAVTFDFGQTLAEVDTELLSRRLAERGVACAPAALARATPAAWRAYNTAVLAGRGGHPWKVLMRAWLDDAGVTAEPDALVDWLWDEQPRVNLWRRPIPGMIEFVRALRRAGVPVAVVSNSEGRLAELIAEMGWAADFDAVADSGRLGMEKPGREIFAWAAARLDTPLAGCVHVGDAWAADFLGALDAGMRAVLFRGGAFVPPGDPRAAHPRSARCDEPAELAAILRGWGLDH
jgi:HAD superfamily hydrolase (TIGR01509 family)